MIKTKNFLIEKRYPEDHHALQNGNLKKRILDLYRNEQGNSVPIAKSSKHFNYEALKRSYIDDSMNGLISMIRSIAEEFSNSIQFGQSSEIILIFINISKNLLLSLVELSIFSMVLDKFEFGGDLQSVRHKLWCIAALVKSKYSHHKELVYYVLQQEGIKPEEIECLEGKLNNFVYLNQNELMKKQFRFANKRFYKLFDSGFDYNNLVDNLLSNYKEYRKEFPGKKKINKVSRFPFIKEEQVNSMIKTYTGKNPNRSIGDDFEFVSQMISSLINMTEDSKDAFSVKSYSMTIQRQDCKERVRSYLFNGSDSPEIDDLELTEDKNDLSNQVNKESSLNTKATKSPRQDFTHLCGKPCPDNQEISNSNASSSFTICKPMTEAK